MQKRGVQRKAAQGRLLDMLFLVLISLISILLLAPAYGQEIEEYEYYPIEEYGGEEDYGTYGKGYSDEEYSEDYEVEELPDIEDVEWEDEVQEAGITSDNWILHPFDSLAEKMRYLFLSSEEAKIEYTLELANERDYELRLLKRKSEIKAGKGDWKAVEEYSSHILDINDKYNGLLLEADEKFSLYQEEETDEEKIDSIYNKAGKVIDRHTLNVVGIKKFVEKYSDQEGTSKQALENLNQIVEYEGLAEEETEEAVPEAMPKQQIPQQQIPPQQVLPKQQIPQQKRMLKPPLKQAQQQQAQIQQPKQQMPAKQTAQKQAQAPAKKDALGMPTGFITTAVSEAKGFLQRAVDYLSQIF